MSEAFNLNKKTKESMTEINAWKKLQRNRGNKG